MLVKSLAAATISAALCGLALTPANAAPTSGAAIPVADSGSGGSSGSSGLWAGSANMPGPGEVVVGGLAVLFCTLGALAPGSSHICTMDLNPHVG
ncbi:hypothetical protein D7D52_06710 [Nocardia yunnanensis]|uniref:DUF320 domain-containing protein n=1 Tax=Nocardia yunnanensis TaxID=2382165 RepID=A0A386Z8W1_9NOCA|nr:hypothetical protein [Nocardia yunnanensis]AYF73593.1 hypothetical protein D7D52_06710 [Nocardia yunnanensis]